MSSTTVLYGRSWRWLRTRILGLLTTPHTYDPLGNPVFTTRLQTALIPVAPPAAGRSGAR